MVPINVPIDPIKKALRRDPVLLKHFLRSASKRSNGIANGTKIWKYKNKLDRGIYVIVLKVLIYSSPSIERKETDCSRSPSGP